MPPERDEETGQYTAQYEDEDFIAAVEAVTMATTSNVAAEVGCSYDLAYRRLQSLYEEERLGRDDVGGSFLWRVREQWRSNN